MQFADSTNAIVFRMVSHKKVEQMHIAHKAGQLKSPFNLLVKASNDRYIHISKYSIVSVYHQFLELKSQNKRKDKIHQFWEQEMVKGCCQGNLSVVQLRLDDDPDYGGNTSANHYCSSNSKIPNCNVKHLT